MKRLIGKLILAITGWRVAGAEPETRRFVEHRDQAPASPHAARVWLLAASGFLGALFLAPASQMASRLCQGENDIPKTFQSPDAFFFSNRITP